jgi:hypothetical protein
MLGQVTIKTESPSVLKPLLRVALENETKILAHGIKRTRERLAAFEKQYGMSSGEFESRFEAGEIKETLDFIDWLMEVQALRSLDEQYQALRNARFA